MTIDSCHVAAERTTGLRKDGTPLTATCTIPLNACGCLAGDVCDCHALSEDVFAEPIFWDLRAGTTE